MNKTAVKIVSIIMAISLLALTFAACGKGDEYEKSSTTEPVSTESTTEAVKPTNINPLTGLADLSESAIGSRPVAIMVENSPEARPQWGITSPDVIVEGVVEGGITRMMWIYADATKIPKIGPLRSARHDYVEIANGMNAIYIHWGGSGQASNRWAYGAMSKLGIDHIDGIKDGAYFKRDSSRSSRGTEHTGYTTGENIVKAIQDKKFNTKEAANYMFSVVDEGVRLPFGSSTGTAGVVNVTFSPNYKYSFKYDSAENKYFSSINGNQIKDGNDSKSLAFSNIIVMFTNVTGVSTTNAGDKKLREWDLSSGDALYISQGMGEKITWKKGDANSPLKFYGTDGKELVINQGKTWIGVVPTDQKSNFNIKES